MSTARRELVRIPAGPVHMEGMLDWPAEPLAVILFAHGSGSSRFSPRNGYVAAQLREAGMATLLIDLLSPEEDQDSNARFDIALLTDRLATAAAWLHRQPASAALPLGLFGASTGAAAALRVAAGARNGAVGAVVSRGGRPDMAGPDALQRVASPTLLIVGGNDDVVLELNREAFARLHCQKELSIVPHATHLFEEAGTLEEVARLATAWFTRHLVPA
ncbi:MAG TPA: alpha/beta family hydrolase [Burkholderiaceae bacterium]|nr:alpha/beta family hydrolase [Burkholderiaceae bacterium]